MNMRMLALVTAVLTLAAPGSTGQEPGAVVLEIKGYVVAAHPVQISPALGGPVIWVDPRFQEGALFKKGERLAVLDPRVYEARLQSARAALQVAEVNLQEVETGSALQQIQAEKSLLKNRTARFELARVDERNKRAAGGGVAREELEKAILQATAEQAAVEQQKQAIEKLETALKERRLVSRAQVQQAQGLLHEAETFLNYCTITAPISGTILSIKVEVGSYVNPLAFGAPGSLCEMADLKELEVEVDVPERDHGRMKPGQPCRILPEAGKIDDAFRKTHPDGYAGIVTRRLPTANRAKGTVTVRIKIQIPEAEQPGEFLLPEMGVIVSIRKM